MTYFYLGTTVKELDGMHKKHLLPGFDDRDAEEVAIQLLTGEITQVLPLVVCGGACACAVIRCDDQSAFNSPATPASS
jgi:hypothetical protein